MPLPRLRPRSSSAPGPTHFPLPALPPHTHPHALTDHHADPVVLQAKAERRFLGTIGHRLLEAGGVPPVAAPAAPTARPTSSIRLLRRPPFRSLGHCRASLRSSDPGEGAGACFLPRHGTAKKALRVPRRSRPALNHRPRRRVANLPERPRSRYFRARARLAPPLRGSSVASHPLAGEALWAGPSRFDQSAPLIV